MTELGARLKEARMLKGYSLEDLQSITKIQKRYLSAIEEGNYNVMPGTFYVRAFIKQYAEAVDLDANELLETYKSELPTNKAAEVAGANTSIQQGTASQANKNSNRRRSNSPKSMGQSKKFSEIMPKFVAGLFIIIIIGAIVFMVWKQPNKDNVAKPDQTPNTVENAQVAKDEKAKEQAAAEAKKKKEEAAKKKKEEEKSKQKLSAGVDTGDGVTTLYTLSGTDKFDIRIEVSGDNWIGVTDENGKALGTSGMYHAGDEVKVDAKGANKVRIRAGAIKNAKIFINDDELKLLKSPEERTTQNIEIKIAEGE